MNLKKWNMDDRRRICIENPMLGMKSISEGLEEAWFLVPEDFAKKTLVLGLL